MCMVCLRYFYVFSISFHFINPHHNPLTNTIKSTSLCFHIFSICACVMRKEMSYPSTAFLRITMNCSARCIKKRVNLWHRISSISSACLILMDTRTLLMEGSIRQVSFSVRDTTTGLRINSLLVLTRRMEDIKTAY